MRLIERFVNSYLPEPNTGCWLWNDKTNDKGYGIFTIGLSNIGAYRLSYYLYKGLIPPKMAVCHSCDTPSCVNPDHLWVGSHADNMADASSKNRMHPGEKNGACKLQEAQVLEIVSLYKTNNYTRQQLSNMFSIGQSTIGRILTGDSWNNMTNIKPCTEREIDRDKIYGVPLQEEFQGSFSEKDSCWIWNKYILSTGYGAMKLGNETLLAHRISYELYNDEIVPGLFVCHSCQSPTTKVVGLQFQVSRY